MILWRMGVFWVLSAKKQIPDSIVREVISGTAAEKAGLKANDILLEVNDEPLDTRKSSSLLSPL